MQMCMSLHPYVFLVLLFLDTFFPVWLFCLIPVSFVFCFILSPFYYYSLDEGETERGSGGVTGRGMGGGKHNLNILYEKKLSIFSFKKETLGWVMRYAFKLVTEAKAVG